MTNPIRPTDDEARALAHQLLQDTRHAALAVLDCDGLPMLSRVGFGLGPDGVPISLVSTLAAHTQALMARPDCAIMIGEPAAKGDALSHPRLSLQGQAEILPRDHSLHTKLAAQYLRHQPKAKLYLQLGDFHFLRLTVTRGFLNGGFGKAFQLTSDDLRP